LGAYWRDSGLIREPNRKGYGYGLKGNIVVGIIGAG
jgi:hypothetical protein